MTTRSTAQKRKKMQKSKPIPLVMYIRFKRAGSREEVEVLNTRFMKKELAREKRKIRRLERKGEINLENGAELLKETCERRLAGAHWSRIRDHSKLVRDVGFKIAMENELVRRSIGKRADQTVVNVIANMSGYHDAGKTLTAPYLINREVGTILGIGRGERIDFETELPVLRLSHVEAGMRLLSLYREYINPKEYLLMKLLIGAHHIAYDGRGSASAPSYPQIIGNIDVSTLIQLKNNKVTHNQFPDVVHIIRTADVFCAALENRFYLSQSERLVNMAKEGGIEAEDAALGLVISVAGTDVDPHMVACLMMAMYKLEYEDAKSVVRKLSCREPKWLDKRGADIKWTLQEVVKRQRFLRSIGEKRESWRKKVNTGVFRRAEVFSED
jgi:hypothetical protein